MSKRTNHESFKELYNIIGDERNNYDQDIKHRHFFQIAGITVCVENFLLPGPIKFKEELLAFRVDGLGEDNITLRHHFYLPDLKGKDFGVRIHHEAPWSIYRKDNIWIYRGIMSMVNENALHKVAIFSNDYSQAVIYNPDRTMNFISDRGFHSLSLFSTDQIWLVPLLADRDALLFHSAAAVIKGQGFIFIGHSDAGKSTTMDLLKEAMDRRGLDVQVLCDDRNIIRCWPTGWRVHGTWSHGDVTDVSPADAPLKGVFFLEQSLENSIIPLYDRRLIWSKLLATLIRAVETPEWWLKELDILERLINKSNFYRMRFDRSGAITTELEKFIR